LSTDGASHDGGFESQLESIPLRLETFEGPLDLLLHLIKKNEVNIYDIPIALITEQYLAYLSLMQELNLDLASEFLVTAATLIHIKSRQLLPRPEAMSEDTGEEIDPRDALVQRLLDHQRFKAAAELLHERETLRNAQWTRPDARVEAIAGVDVEPELDVDLFGLLAAFRRVLERSKLPPAVPLPPEETSIESRIEQLLERLSETEACGFEDLFDDVATRGDLIVTFLALLEMVRLKLVRAFQQSGGPIRVYRRARPTDAPHPIHDPEDEFKAHHRDAGGDVPPPSAARLDDEPASAGDVGDADADDRDDEDDEQ